MKVFHIELAKVGGSLSGGEKCMVELIKHIKKKGVLNVVVTTDNGKELYVNLGLTEDEYLKYIVINSAWSEKYFHIFFSYILRLFYFKKIKNTIYDEINKHEDVLICHSDFFPNTIPAYFLKKHFLKKSLWFFHMQAPSVFRGFLGQFTAKFTCPSLSRVHYILNQQLFFSLIKRVNGCILAVNPYYSDFLSKKKIEYYIIEKFGGADIELESVHSQKLDDKEFHLVFLGRFHEQKGLLEIPEILEVVVRSVPHVKMAIVGSGNAGIEKKLNRILKEKNLDKNVKMFGSLAGNEKVAVLNQSKIFIFPSYFESFGIVALEAMGRGLPVVSYNLPVYGVFQGGMIKVPVLDNVSFSGAIVNLLNNDSEYKKMSLCAKSFASSFSWEKTSEEVLNLIRKL